MKFTRKQSNQSWTIACLILMQYSMLDLVKSFQIPLTSSFVSKRTQSLITQSPSNSIEVAASTPRSHSRLHTLSFFRLHQTTNGEATDEEILSIPSIDTNAILAQNATDGEILQISNGDTKTTTKVPPPQNGTDIDADAISMSTVGRTVAAQSDGVEKAKADFIVSAPDLSRASESVLAIDPSTIEIIPFSQLSEEGQVLGGAYSGTEFSDGETDSPNPVASAKTKSLFSFVNMFRGSATYIANHRNTIVVFHIPGELLEWEGFSDLMDDISLCWLLGMKPVVIVGCRTQVDDRLMESIDTECDITSLSPDGKQVDCQDEEGTVRYDSVRVTDLDTLRIVKEEAGFVRFEVERQLGRSLYRHGLMDEDSDDGNIVSGNFFSAQPYGVIDGLDFQFTGFPRRVETEKIKQVLNAHDIVLLTSLGVSPSGEIFNVNTEHLASFVAGALKATKVIYFTTNEIAFREKENKKLVQNLRVSDARKVLQYNNVTVNQAKGFTYFEHDARLPLPTKEAFVKLGWCVSSLERGVKRAHIISPINGALLQELYTRDGSGTLISRDIYEGIRVADVGDVTGIFELIEPLVNAGTLVPRPKNVLEKEIESYYVFTRDSLIVACAQIKLFENGFAEIGCLVVKKEYRSQGRGDAMLGYLERLSVQVGCANIFVLSTQTMEWFVERDFAPVNVGDLPPSRQAIYNHVRKSKIYMKRIEDKRELDAAELWWDR
jgi:amino-acid N-acetyltransferase